MVVEITTIFSAESHSALLLSMSQLVGLEVTQPSHPRGVRNRYGKVEYSPAVLFMRNDGAILADHQAQRPISEW